MASLAWLRQDLQYAVKSLRRSPTITAAAVVTLALGIGATTTVYSVFHAVLLRPLPVASPEQLYFVAHGTSEGLSTSSHYPWFERVAWHTDIFAGVAAYNIRDFKVSTGEGAERVVGQYASGNYHALIRVPIQIGRGFNGEPDHTLNPIAVISDGYWSRRFSRSPDVLGKSVTVGTHPVTIVGVTAPGFDGMQPGRSIDITLPLSVRIQDEPTFLFATDTWTSMPLVARLKPGVDPSHARDVIASTYREYMSLPANQEFSRAPSGQLRSATLQPGAQGSDRLRQEYATPLRELMSMVAIVLLVACVNVANLLLIRAPSRAREVAVRMSIGAGRYRIARQLLTESVLLSVCGGAIGVLLAAWGTDFASALFQAGARPIVIDIQPDRGVLTFALAMSLLTGVAFGVAPAWKTTAIDVAQTLKVGGSAAGAGRRQVGQRALVAAQIALSLMLVFSAALLARTLQNLRTGDAGFGKDAMVLFELDAQDTPFRPDQLEALCGDVVNKLKSLPAVLAGSCSTMSPIATNTEGRAINVAGFAPGPGEPPIVFANSVDASYFESLGIPVLRGQAFTTRDTAASSPVAVVSESMAHYYFGDDDPIGRTFRFGRTDLGPPITIVGVARNARQQLRDAPPHMVYTPLSQRQEPPSSLLGAVRDVGAHLRSCRGGSRSSAGC